jgi:two-component system response regulator YesN
MRRAFELNGNLLLQNFIINLIVVLFLLLIMSQLFYFGFNNSYKSIVNNEKSREFEASVSEFSQELNEMDKISYSILTNNKTSPYAINRGGYWGIVATKEIAAYMVGNSFIADILLYTCHNDRYLLTTANSICDPDIAFTLKYGYSASLKTKIDHIINTTRETVLLSPANVIGENQNTELKLSMENRLYPQRAFIYIVPSPSYSPASRSSVLFLIQESVVKNFLKKTLSNYNGYLYMFDNEWNIMTYAQGDDVTINAMTFLSKFNSLNFYLDDFDGKTFKINNISYTAFLQYTGNRQHSFLMIIPTAQHLEPINQWMHSLMIFLIIALILGIILSILITLTNYSPIYRLTGFLNNLLKLSQKPAIGKELPYISTAFNSLVNQNTSLQEEIQELSVVRRRDLLLNIFNGNLVENEILSQVAAANMKLDKPFFIVLYLLIDNYPQFELDHSDKMRLVLKKCIITKFEETLSLLGNAYVIELANPSAYGILLNIDHTESVSSKLANLSRNLITYFSDNFELSLTVGISHVYCTLKHIPLAYRQAQAASEYRLIYGSSRVILYNSCEVKSGNRLWYPVTLEKELLEAIDLVDANRIFRILNYLVQEIRTQNLCFQEVQFICFGIISSITRLLFTMELEPDSEFSELRATFVNFRFETLEQIQNQLHKLSLLACKYISIKRSNIKNTLLENILKFVSENYHDSTLCLESIAQQFNYSASYISHFFKEQTGETLIKYIDNFRIKRAKQLLRETDYSLTDILTLVGYNDKNNFIRKFKKLENITPIQYRNSYLTNILNILEI